jgi:diguanylate cyclase (GGDEF)-like protein/PAS domain S-box-containing protein
MLSDSRFTNRARFGALLVGLALPCIACAVIVGWMTHTPALVQVLPAAPVMSFNTATSFFWLGIALVFLVSQRLWLPRYMGAAITMFAALTLCQEFFEIDLGIDNLHAVDWGGVGPNTSDRMAAITAICFLLSGMCVVSLSFVPGRRFQPLFECLFGSIVFANGAVSAFGYLLGLESSYGWGGSLGMAIHTATSFTFVGLAIIGLALVHERCWSSSMPKWLPLPVSLCAATAAIALCQALYLDESKQTSHTTLARAEKFSAQISMRLTSRIQSMERMAHRWAIAGRPLRTHFGADAEQSLKHFVDIQAIAWIDPDGHVAWLVPRYQSSDLIHDESLRESSCVKALRAAHDERRTTITPATTQVPSGQGCQMFCPIFRGDKFEGYLSSTFGVQELVADLARESMAAGYQVAIVDETQTLFCSSPVKDVKGHWSASPLERGGIHWYVSMCLTPEAAAALRSRLPVGVLCCGLLFAVVLGLAIHYALQAHERSQAAERASAALRTSQERFELAVRGSSDGIWDWNLETDETYYSPRFMQLLGYVENASINWKDLLHPEDRETTLSALQSHLERSTPFDVTCRLWTNDKTARWFRLRGEATRFEPGHARRMAGSLSDITALKEVEEKLASAALLDKLTSLPNRALLLDRLQHLMARASRSADYHYAVMFIDFDRFKVINDSLGHDVGDALLREIANRLRSSIRSVDSVSRVALGNTTARLGGDEFVILLDELADPGDIHVVARRLLDALAKPYQLGVHEVHSSASVGIVCGTSAYTNADEVLRDADTAMYEAKRAGKARYVVFDDSMRRCVQRRLKLENDLRKAIGTEQLSLVFQPIVSLPDGDIYGVEALLRWHHPTEGMIGPAEFIPVAEECDLIHALGDWVLRTGCRQMAKWIEVFGPQAPAMISINLSRKQFSRASLYADIRQALIDTGLPTNHLQLEITEVAFNSDAEAAVTTMHALRELGVHLAVDDFGTGASTFAAVHEFPIDMLKIDRSFLAGIEDSPDTVAMIQALKALADSLNITMVAEGVETQSQVALLEELDCQYAQGYYFAKPMTAAEFESLVSQRLFGSSVASAT